MDEENMLSHAWCDIKPGHDMTDWGKNDFFPHQKSWNKNQDGTRLKKLLNHTSQIKTLKLCTIILPTYLTLTNPVPSMDMLLTKVYTYVIYSADILSSFLG